MNKQKLVDLLKQPATIDAKHLDEIVDIVQENPYFHSAYALIAFGRKKISPKQATKDLDLIRAAIYATNRVNLKKYLEAHLGGSQASSASDAIVEKSLSEKKIVSKEEGAPTIDDKKVTTITRPANIDLENVLDNLKSEYKQLEVNIKNFDQAEKSLSAVEIEKASEAKTITKKSAQKNTTKAATKKAVPAAKKTVKPTAKKATTIAKKPALKAKTTKTTTKKRGTTNSSTTDTDTKLQTQSPVTMGQKKKNKVN